MLSQTVLDKDISFPIADFSVFKNKVIVSSYDSILRVYNSNVHECSIPVHCTYTKLCEFNSNLLCISYSTGVLSVFDSEMNNVCNMKGFKNPNIIHTFGKYVLIATRNEEVFVLQENSEFVKNQTSFFTIVNVIQRQKMPTFISSFKNLLAISFENTLCLFNENLEEIFTKSYSATISSIDFYSEFVILLGLQNGKIQIENIEDSDESFLFNSHFICSSDQKVLYPVTHLTNFNNFILSSGYEGKLIKWDLEQKRMVASILDCKKFIRKFVILEKSLYVLIEDNGTNSLCYSEVGV